MKEFSLVVNAANDIDRNLFKDAASQKKAYFNAHTYNMIMMEAGSAVLRFLDDIASIPKNKANLASIATNVLGGAWNEAATADDILEEIKLAEEDVRNLETTGVLNPRFIQNRLSVLEAGKYDVSNIKEQILNALLQVHKIKLADMNLPDAVVITANLALTQTMHHNVQVEIWVGRESVEFFFAEDYLDNLKFLRGGICTDDRLDDWGTDRFTSKLEGLQHEFLKQDDFRKIQDILLKAEEMKEVVLNKEK